MFTRETLISMWQRYGTGTRLTNKQIDGMLAVLNQPLDASRTTRTLCGESLCDLLRNDSFSQSTNQQFFLQNT